MVAEKILVVDDEPNIRDVLTTVLEFHGFEVATAATGVEALAKAEAYAPALIVLDLVLPDADGLSVCRDLRARGHRSGIVFLTARDSRSDLVSGLTYGGDDYITKPFALDELLARVRAVLRRVGTAPDRPGSATLRVGDAELDEDTCQASRNGVPLRLSPTEFKLLRFLMANEGRVLSRAQILDAVWDYDYSGMSTVVDTYVGYLRRKLDPLGPPLIHTQRGFGYIMRAPGRRPG
ncbi:response regulator transcription factor [Planomonospora sp. ID82291]|uniref:response regulator transcription factor n=1 Tax=Planomonospora sp. ID82291 TaxID=2738136 RepID=UPI0018C381A1|nr:response regulator transcription factor [Planomonospora sp. ID82291]